MVMTEDELALSKPKRVRKKAEPKVAEVASNGTRTAMSDEHKAALAEGREHGRIVRAYLEALENHKPRRGRRRTPESIQARLATVIEQMETANALDRLHLAQEKMDLEAALTAHDDEFDITSLEEQFVGVAAAYSDRKGLTRDAWKAAGVPPRVLTAAGIRA